MREHTIRTLAEYMPVKIATEVVERAIAKQGPQFNKDTIFLDLIGRLFTEIECLKLGVADEFPHPNYHAHKNHQEAREDF